MKFTQLTLWELLKSARRNGRKERSNGSQTNAQRDADKRPRVPRDASSSPVDQSARKRPTMRERYDALVIEMKQTHGVRIRKWRKSSSGCAWEVHYANGGMTRLIESPYPRGPMSCAIFLHEVGHHAIGFGRYRPRCLEEYHAWRWALEQMEQRGLNVTPAVRKRMAESLHYALRKARHRGLKHVPKELLPYLHLPASLNGEKDA